jgi:hypothetical protein
MTGVIIGASVGGILGALLAAPIIASTREILRYLYAKIWNEEPFPFQAEEPPQISLSWQEQMAALMARGRQLLARRPGLPAKEKSQAAEASSENKP